MRRDESVEDKNKGTDERQAAIVKKISAGGNPFRCPRQVDSDGYCRGLDSVSICPLCFVMDAMRQKSRELKQAAAEHSKPPSSFHDFVGVICESFLSEGS